VRKNDLTVAVVVLIDHDARSRGANQSRQFVLAMFDWRTAQVRAIELNQVEGA
jgi:hypothetical protein